MKVRVFWLLIALTLIVDATLSMVNQWQQSFWPWQVGRLFREAVGVLLIAKYVRRTK